MTRVLLFTQTGDGKPKCEQGVLGDVKARATPREPWLDCPGWTFTAGQIRRGKAANRWWLVECENAEAGRYCIAGGCKPYECHRADGPLSCRILASGGKP